MSNLPLQRRRQRRNFIHGIGFLAPNLLGFLAFTLIPLLLSLFMAFSNWDLRLHNIFVREPLRFVGLDQFRTLLEQKDFWKFLGNTLFLMMGIPLTIIGSLMAAILLSQDFRVASGRRLIYLIAGVLLIGSTVILALAGAGATGMVLLMSGVVCLVLIGGMAAGSTVYRTLFYVPHFTAGVAVFLLWKKLYSPQGGPVNNFLAPILDGLAGFVRVLPAHSDMAMLIASRVLMLGLLLLGLNVARKQWTQGDWGTIPIVLGLILLGLPVWYTPRWGAVPAIDQFFPLAAGVVLLVQIVLALRVTRMPCPLDEGMGNALVLSALLMTLQFALLGLGNVGFHLPQMAADGLEPPKWLNEYHWAKPAIMIMSIWASIGSNNMLLYLAGLSNVPVELQEAADIDGATRFQRFWHVTWPQLAPVTFFIVIMSVMGGLQGGFEMARAMTAGGPAGATTTLSYFVYTEAFENGRMGYASAIAWVLFAMVFLITLFNWKFGSRYVND